MIYSDGIAVVSLFIERLDRHDPDSSGASGRGGLNTYVRHENGYQITAVGEVPRPTVEGMVNSVTAAE
jgi:sigma-E factor negative regulatory protein RseB